MSIKTVFVSAVTDSHATDVEGVGTLRFETDGKIYRYVKNVDTANSMSAGSFACHTITDGATANKNVALPATANLTFMAGIVASTTLAANTGTLPKCFGWIQVGGLVEGAFLPAGTLTAGSVYIPTNNSSAGTAFTLTGITSSYYDRNLIIRENGSSSAALLSNCAAQINGCI